MISERKNDLDEALEENTRRFLRDHPEAEKALDIFGIAHGQYQQYLAAQRGPIFYTASSTIEGDFDGELDGHPGGDN